MSTTSTSPHKLKSPLAYDSIKIAEALNSRLLAQFLAAFITFSQLPSIFKYLQISSTHIIIFLAHLIALSASSLV